MMLDALRLNGARSLICDICGSATCGVAEFITNGLLGSSFGGSGIETLTTLPAALGVILLTTANCWWTASPALSRSAGRRIDPPAGAEI
jgi:hypothetical protein